VAQKAASKSISNFLNFSGTAAIFQSKSFSKEGGDADEPRDSCGAHGSQMSFSTTSTQW